MVYQLPRGARVAQWVRSLDLTTHTSLSPIRRGFASGFADYKKGALDPKPQVIQFTSCLPRVGGSLRVLRLPYQLLAQGRWFSPGTPAFSTTKTGRRCLPTVGGSLRVLRLLPPLKLVAWYSWNIVESGVKTPNH